MLYKIFQICTTLPLVKISAQPDVVYWICYPKTPQSRSNWVLNQKNVLFLLGKVENNKYTEIKTWNPERIEEWSYYRFCETLWHDHKGQFRPIRPPPIFYLFIYLLFLLGGGWGRLQESGDFSGTLKLFYLIFQRMQFLQKFWFIATFLVFQQYIGPQNGPKL